MKNNKKLIQSFIAIGILAVVIIIMLFTYNQLKPQGIKGAKEIVVAIVIPEEETTEIKLNTEAKFLRQALEEKQLIKGMESEFGLFITEVNGRTADDAKEEWWCITKNQAQLDYGVDTIEIADGDHYEITLLSGY